MDKMVTKGGSSIHLQKVYKLSKEWGEGENEKLLVHWDYGR